MGVAITSDSESPAKHLKKKKDKSKKKEKPVNNENLDAEDSKVEKKLHKENSDNPRLESPPKHLKKKKDKDKKKGKRERNDDLDMEDSPVKKKIHKENSDAQKIEGKSKFSISLGISEDVGIGELKPLKSSGKGPKIIIAKETKDDSLKTNTNDTKKSGKNKNKKNKDPESVHESKGMGKALRYLKTWSEDRESWKFEKCRQIWLLHNAYDVLRVSDKIFPSLLCYIESVKGGMREKTLTTAQEKVKISGKWEELLAEDKAEEEVEKEIGAKISESELKRARQIVEILCSDS